jgi:hypothetical protein
MQEQQKKCKGTTKKGKPCEKPPLTGEDYCEKHHPTKKLQRKLWKSIVLNIGLFLTIIFFICNRYLSDKSTKNIQVQISQTGDTLKENIRQHSLAERILDSQYNPVKLGTLMQEVLNLMNNDPNFKKTFHIDSKGINLQIDNSVYGKDFTINFTKENAKRAFEEFLKGGKKSLTINDNDYDFFYVLKNGEVVDSFKNETFNLARDFPELPFVNISTVDPTGDYLCTSILNIQIDSMAGEYIYISNSNQNIPFKILLKYNVREGTTEFNQLEDIFFDSKSSFYSIHQEISYYEFLLALLSNARIRIRNAITGDSILTTEHFLPVNIDIGGSSENINNKLSILRTLKKVQDIWGIIFTRSDITKEEFMYLKGITHSYENGSEVTSYPFKFTLPKDEAKKIIDRKANIGNASYRIICNKNIINLLDRKLPLGRLVIILPPSHLEYHFQNNFVAFSVSPIKKGDVVIYKFADLSGFTKPSNIIDSEIIRPNQDKNFISFVKNIKIPLAGWENTKLSEKKFNFD